MSFFENYIEVPFEKRHQCWFCGEPAGNSFGFPHQGHLVLDCPHPSLTLPSCSECQQLALAVKADSIWQVSIEVKRALINKYQKDLAIGINWTKQELAESQFEGGNFAGFQKSAWFMFEVAKGRVNHIGWPLVLNGIELEVAFEKEAFTFDGICYPSIDDAISHYAKAYYLHAAFFKQVVSIMSKERFADAVRFCRLLVGATPQERGAALKNLRT